MTEFPWIECGNCGSPHHIDSASGETQGHCRDCNAFLRRPTEDEEIQYGEWLLATMDEETTHD